MNAGGGGGAKETKAKSGRNANGEWQ